MIEINVRKDVNLLSDDLGSPPARGKGVGPDEARASAGLGVATFRPFGAVSATEKPPPAYGERIAASRVGS